MSKKQFKLKTATKQIVVPTPNEITNIDTLQKEILQAKNVETLQLTATKIIKLRKEFDDINKQLKFIIAEKTAQAKTIKEQIDDLEASAKEVALKLVKVETKTKVRKSTGEVYKETSHNLDSAVFTYTPAKRTTQIDTKAIAANENGEYTHLLVKKTVYELDLEAIGAAPAESVP